MAPMASAGMNPWRINRRTFDYGAGYLIAFLSASVLAGSVLSG